MSEKSDFSEHPENPKQNEEDFLDLTFLIEGLLRLQNSMNFDSAGWVTIQNQLE